MAPRPTVAVTSRGSGMEYAKPIAMRDMTMASHLPSDVGARHARPMLTLVTRVTQILF